MALFQKFCIVGMACTLLLVCAQAQEPDAALKQLTPATQDVIKGLSQLDRLPAPQWRTHVADMPHGEALELDDSSWEVAHVPSQEPRDALWYRAWVEVPKDVHGYDVTGSRIWFSFHVWSDGDWTKIVYFNGRRVALGEDLEPITIFDQAKPGDKVLVAVKLSKTVDVKHVQGSTFLLEPVANRLSPERVWKELLSAGELTPVSGGDAGKLVDSAAATVDLAALGRGDQKAFDASLQKAEATLEPLKGQLKQFSANLTGNSHIDAAWLWPETETVDVVRRTFTSALQLLDEYPQSVYTQSAAQYSEWMEQKYPSLFRGIADQVKNKRWELVGGMWVEPDLNMPDGESQVRQLLVGKRYFKQHLGVDVRIGWNPDTFGYNWQLPQIYKRSGVDYFVTQKMSWNETNKLPLKLFWWESPDGSKVLTYFPDGYSGDIDPLKLARDFVHAETLAPGLQEVLHLYGEGDHGGGPTRAMFDRGLMWSDQTAVFPKLNFASAQNFFSEVESKIDASQSPEWNYKSVVASPKLPAPPADKIEIPTWKDELYFEFHRGVFTTQSNHKRNMRESEEQLLNAEKYSALAWLSGDAYPGAELTEGWKKALFNQFHDLAAGSGIGVIYKDAQHDYDVIRWTTDEASAHALHTLSAEVNTKVATPGGVPVMVWNPLAWQRDDLVTLEVQMPGKSASVSVIDSRGKALPVQVLSTKAETNSYQLLVKASGIPSLGYEVLHVVPGQRAVVTDLQASGLTLENALVRVTVDEHNGCITSLYDKKANFESLAAGACGNQLIAFHDNPKEYDAWNIDANFEDGSMPLDQVESVKLVEQGPLRATIRVTRSWQSSKFVQDITLYAGLDRVDIGNDIDWHERHILIKAAFPLAASSNDATYEIPYGTIERPTTRNNSWESAKFEVPALRWADLGDGKHGVSLINESKYGYDAKGNVLRISLLRSPTSPDPEADQGKHHFSYSLYPHAGDWKQALTVRRGYEFNYKLHAEQVMAHDGKLGAEHSYASVDARNVVLTAMKKAEDGDGLIFRFYEWGGQSGNVAIRVPANATSATLTNLMEEPSGSALPVSAGTVVVPVHPFEIVSVRVNYGK
ncbi:MAG TPA: glycoside hydrolase family 38 C-terminal domain-containing protein [Terriglobales bacterium]|nr:glycoside hydrolase family 38 C-terminal domain-containing protein [Terriglobales bacterium]